MAVLYQNLRARKPPRGLSAGHQSPVAPDFLIGAHALDCADALITRDRGFLRDYFTDFKIIDPSLR